MPQYITSESIALFERFKVLSAVEVASRYEVKLENYSKKINIEGQVTARMARARFIPAIIEFSTAVASSIVAKQSAVDNLDLSAEKELLAKLNEGLGSITTGVAALDNALAKAQALGDPQTKANTYLAEVIPAMNAVRTAVDEMEVLVGHDYWPVPSYNHMLFYT
jgi:glutamine synthetase